MGLKETPREKQFAHVFQKYDSHTVLKTHFVIHATVFGVFQSARIKSTQSTSKSASFVAPYVDFATTFLCELST